MRPSELPSACLLALAALLAAIAHAHAANRPEPIAEAELPTSAVRPVSLLPRAITSFGAAFEDGWLYVLGGYFGTPHEYDREGQSRSFARMNAHDGTWEELERVEPVQGATLVARGGALYRIGGMVARNAPEEPADLASIDTFARYDPRQGTWTALPPLPEARSSHAAAVVGDSVWVVGGWNLASERTWSDHALRFDLTSPQDGWQELAVPFRRRALGAAAIDGRLVVVGGITEEGSVSNRVDVLDVESGTWSRGPDIPGKAFGAAAAATGNAVYASAGSGIVHGWRPEDEAWRPVSSWVFPRFFHQLAADADDAIFAVGGIARGGRIRHVERLDLTLETAEPSVVTWDLPSPVRSKNRQGVFLRDNSLYFFGGNRSLGQHDFEAEDFLDAAYRLDLASLSFEALSPFPVRRQSLVSALSPDGTKGFLVGGFGHDGGVARTQDAAFRYDFRTDDWTELEGWVPGTRSQFGLAEHEGTLWLFGGLDYHPERVEESFRHVLDVLSWNVEDEGSGFAPTGVELPGPRRAFGMAQIDALCYFVGGMREDFQLVEDCAVFDVETRTWDTIPGPRRTRISPELVALGGRLYLAGGSSDRGEGLRPDPSLEVYDPREARWSVLIEELPIVPRHVRMFAFGDRLLLVSTHIGEQRARLALVDLATHGLGGRDVAMHFRR